jgi:hypothetical protein
MLVRVLLAASVLVLAVACGSVEDGQGQAPTVDEPTAAAPASEETSMGVDPVLEGVVAQAVQDLAARAGIDPGEITVVSAEPVVWPDGSLGCPQPGMRYIQVPEDGALIQLEAAGRSYRYHTGGSRTQPFLCEQVGKPSPVTPDPRLTPSFDPET